MAAKDRAGRHARGLLCRFAAAQFGAEDQARKESAASDQVVNYLIDTNVVSEWVKPRPNRDVIAWLAHADEEEIFISVCTIAELRFGIASMTKGKRRDQLEDWLRNDLTARFDRRIVAIDI